jgi:hypothetical protein
MNMYHWQDEKDQDTRARNANDTVGIAASTINKENDGQCIFNHTNFKSVA